VYPTRAAAESELSGSAETGIRRAALFTATSVAMMICREPFLIDFQGMRFALLYDPASLLCDPYVNFSPAEREELILLPQLSNNLIGAVSNASGKLGARLMQALGCYGSGLSGD
jgi:hypothetical protein